MIPTREVVAVVSEAAEVEVAVVVLEMTLKVADVDQDNKKKNNTKRMMMTITIIQHQSANKLLREVTRRRIWTKTRTTTQH